MKEYADIDEAVEDVESSMLESITIAKKMMGNIPDKNNWRDLAIVTQKAFGSLFDTILEFAKPDDDSWKTKRFDDKAELIGELKILNEIYEQDFKLLNKIRVHVAHTMEIDESKIKSLLHQTHTYNYNKEKMEKMTLQEKYYAIALRAIHILRHHHSQFMASYLNKMDGWQGSYYNYD
jgi:hypothetical protein